MAQPTQQTAGYPNVEKLIDSEDFNALNTSFTKAYKDLEKLSKEKKGIRTNREAKKAMQALEKVVELFKELLQIKYRMQEQIAQNQKKG